MDTKYLMECGHVAQGKDSRSGAPVCAICIGISPGATKVAKECTDPKDGLEGRKAKCSGHTSSKGRIGICESKWTLPFFCYQPDKEFDSYYCGCYGWD